MGLGNFLQTGASVRLRSASCPTRHRERKRSQTIAKFSANASEQGRYPSMSWSPPACPNCQSPTRFDSPVPDGPELTCGLAWTCDACGVDVLELIPHGPARPRPGHCLNCDEQIDATGD